MIVGRGFRVGVVRGVVGGVLREPDRSVDAVPEMLRAGEGGVELGGAVGLGGERREGQESEGKKSSRKTQAQGHGRVSSESAEKYRG
jgi:hypothetical protein